MPPKKERVQLTCEQCGNRFELLECQTKRGRGRFCSRSCQARAKIERLNATRKPARENLGWFTRERVIGSNNPRWVKPEEFVCLNCAKPFNRKTWVIKQNGNKAPFCSSQCRSQYSKTHLSGENSPLWKGGELSYRGRNWRRIRLIVVERQAGCCAHCGKYLGKSLPVHHIKPFRQFQSAEEANSIANLIGLCQSCHMKLEMPRQWIERRQKVLG